MAVLNYRDPATQQFVPLGGGGPPIGVIANFPGGVSVPAGWVTCDGRTHGSAALAAVIGSPTTPDLKDRFVVGAGPTMPAGSVGGVSTVTLTAAQSGIQSHTHYLNVGAESASHTHTFASAAGDSSHRHNAYRSNFVDWADLSNDTSPDHVAMSNSSKPMGSAAAVGAHTHGGTSGGQSANHVHGMSAAASAAIGPTAAHDNLPPYYVMIYIIRAA